MNKFSSKILFLGTLVFGQAFAKYADVFAYGSPFGGPETIDAATYTKTEMAGWVSTGAAAIAGAVVLSKLFSNRYPQTSAAVFAISSAAAITLFTIAWEGKKDILLNTAISRLDEDFNPYNSKIRPFDAPAFDFVKNDGRVEHVERAIRNLSGLIANVNEQTKEKILKLARKELSEMMQVHAQRETTREIRKMRQEKYWNRDRR